MDLATLRSSGSDDGYAGARTLRRGPGCKVGGMPQSPLRTWGVGWLESLSAVSATTTADATTCGRAAARSPSASPTFGYPMVHVCGLPTTRRAAQAFTSFCPPRSSDACVRVRAVWDCQCKSRTRSGPRYNCWICSFVGYCLGATKNRAVGSCRAAPQVWLIQEA
jgi:hypothetical protein